MCWGVQVDDLVPPGLGKGRVWWGGCLGKRPCPIGVLVLLLSGLDAFTRGICTRLVVTGFDL